MRVLYAGDSALGGPANYLLGILRWVRADVLHIPPSKKLSPALFKNRYDAIILSDFPKRLAPLRSQQKISQQVAAGGAGLWMVGGWASFSGPQGQWRGSLIEKILPVACLNGDDRLHFPAGGAIISKSRSSIFDFGSPENLPVICGMNLVKPKKDSSVLLVARKIVRSRRHSTARSLRLEQKEYPLLVVGADPNKRVAAFAADLAPHWCGGLLDWGKKRLKLPVQGRVQIEVGDSYVRFVASILGWLGGGRVNI